MLGASLGFFLSSDDTCGASNVIYAVVSFFVLPCLTYSRVRECQDFFNGRRILTVDKKYIFFTGDFSVRHSFSK